MNVTNVSVTRRQILE